MDRVDASLAGSIRRVVQALGMVGLLAGPAAADPPTLAVFYGSPVPIDALLQFDRVVVEADNLHSPKPLSEAGVEVYAYVSVGEAEGWRDSTAALPPSLFLGSNPAWNSRIADLANPDWRHFLLETRMAGLWQQGYRGFFLDTLDSYELLPGDGRQRARQEEALVAFIRTVHERFPGVKLVANRGFKVLPQVAPLLSGLVAESLFRKWDPQTRSYFEVSPDDRQWLLERLWEARDRYGLPVAVIDYLPPAERNTARALARRITSLGFTPWVSNVSLDMLGVGAVEVQPRRVLVLYDSGEFPDFRDSPAHRRLALPLEYLGCIVEPLDVRGTLPAYPLAGRYAGIASWFAGDAVPEPQRYRNWLVQHMEAGVPVAILGRLGFSPDAPFLRRLGLARAGRLDSPLKFAERDELTLLGAKPAVRRRGFAGFAIADPSLKTHLVLNDAEGRRVAAVMSGPWGGMALDPYVMQGGPRDQFRWLLDPFRFLAEALRLPTAPAPDVTTLNGRRVLTVQVDGDGASRPAEMPGTPPAAEVIGRNLIAAYPLPTTVSVAESDAASRGTDSPAAAPLQEGLQRILRLPHVEAAGYSYSHPESWGAPSLTFGVAQVPPMGVSVDGRYQVYAPVAGDGIHTDRGPAPFYGSRRVVESFELTDKPLRLKPIGIHYRFHAGTQPAAADALEEVYEWAAKQETFPLWLSEYAGLVEDFQQISIARRGDGAFQIRNLRSQATVRLPKEAGWPDLERSVGVLGVRDSEQGRFVHLLPDRRGSALLRLTPAPPAGPHLVAANAFVERWERAGTGIRLSLRGHVPIRLAIGSPGHKSCALHPGDGSAALPARRENDSLWFFDLRDKVSLNAVLVCR